MQRWYITMCGFLRGTLDITMIRANEPIGEECLVVARSSKDEALQYFIALRESVGVEECLLPATHNKEAQIKKT